ncbi:MAG: hypothetical protein QXU18_04250 [Thermoplasmatales archaeon]
MRITQRDYEYFRDSIDELMTRYREEFSLQVTTDWKEYEFLYERRMKNMALELRSMVNDASSMVVDEFGRHPLLGIGKDINYKIIERLY